MKCHIQPIRFEIRFEFESRFDSNSNRYSRFDSYSIRTQTADSQVPKYQPISSTQLCHRDFSVILTKGIDQLLTVSQTMSIYFPTSELTLDCFCSYLTAFRFFVLVIFCFCFLLLFLFCYFYIRLFVVT